MKNKSQCKPTASQFSLLRQLCNFIPPHLVPQLARDTHSLGLNAACDALRLRAGPLSAVRGANAVKWQV